MTMLPLLLLFAVNPAASNPGCEQLPAPAQVGSRLSELFDYDRPAESEAELLKLAGLAQTCGNRELAAASLAQAARAQGIQGRLADAKATLAKAQPLAGSAETRTRILLEKGRIARREKKGDEARALLEAAFDTARRGSLDALAADAAHMLAMVVAPSASPAWTERGLAIAEASADPAARRWVGNLAYNAGILLSEQGSHASAALMFARSLAARRVENDAELVAAAELALSAELAHLGQVEQARAIQERLLREAGNRPDFLAEVRQQLEKTAALRQAAPSN